MKGGQKVGYAVNIKVRDHFLLVHAVTFLINLHILKSGDSGEGQDSLQATGGAQEDVCVQAVSHHNGALRVDTILLGDAVEDEAARLPDDIRLALGGHLHGSHQTAGTCGAKEGRGRWGSEDTEGLGPPSNLQPLGARTRNETAVL